MNRVILICATIFVFVIGVGCASAADLDMASSDAPALDDGVSIVMEHGIGAPHVEPDVQKTFSYGRYPDLEKEQNRPIASFWDLPPFDFSNNMTDCGE